MDSSFECLYFNIVIPNLQDFRSLPNFGWNGESWGKNANGVHLMDNIRYHPTQIIVVNIWLPLLMPLCRYRLHSIEIFWHLCCPKFWCLRQKRKNVKLHLFCSWMTWMPFWCCVEYCLMFCCSRCISLLHISSSMDDYPMFRFVSADNDTLLYRYNSSSSKM